MRINPVSINIPFIRRKKVQQKPILAQEEILKMIHDEKADEKELIPKLRMLVIREYGVIEGEKSIDGNKEK